jgi:hypothetical protein
MNTYAGGQGYYPTYEYNEKATPGELTVDNEVNDAYANSPVSSPGIYTPQELGSYNSFDQSFSGGLQPSPITNRSAEIPGYSSSPYPQIDYLLDWNPNWTQTDIHPIPSYVALSLVHDPDTQTIRDPNYITDSATYSPTSFLTSSIPEDYPQSAFKPASQATTEPLSRLHLHSRDSKSRQPSSQVKKKKRQSPSTKRTSMSGSSKGHQLRSTKPGHTINYSGRQADSRTGPTKALKTSHNMVEKQYRTRLNGQFSTLLEALPADLVGTEIKGYGWGNSGGTEKKVSKSDVLVLAKRQIELLERQNSGLEGRNGELVEDIQRLKGEWVGIGAQLFP